MDFDDYLPESLPLVTPTYSLEPDMMFGWRPKNLINSGPIPLIFDCDFPDTFNLLINKTNKPIYNGPRPKDSFTIHRHLSNSRYSNYPYNFSDPMISAYEFMSRMYDEPEPREFNGMTKNRSAKCLSFDSDFECGNLDRVLYVNDNEYDLYIRSDSNTSRHYHWFYFKVTDIEVKRTVKFNIVNYSRYSPLWDCGQTPVFKSKLRQKTDEIWERIESSVKFLPSRLNKTFGNGPPKYWMLSFSYTFESEETEVWFAATVPYSYTDCISFINRLTLHPSVTSDTLCKTISGIELPILTITDNTEPEDVRKYMFITGRVHPSETVGSWVMKGFLKFLIGNSPEALELRSLYVFKVIPMLNPDGVILGNSRTSMEGDDINRTYKNPDPRLHPVSYAVRNFIKKMNVRSQVVLFLDMHGHMCKKGSFMYGPYYPLHHDLYLKSRIYPKILGDRTLMFRYFSCRFRIERAKRTAARVVMFKDLGVPMSYTLETSYFGYIREDRKTVPYSIEDLQQLGQDVGKGLLDYHKAVEEEAIQTELRAKERAIKKLKINGGLEDECIENSSISSSAGDSRKTIDSLINSIKQDEEEMHRSDSEDSGSESDYETKRETIRRRKKLIAFMENYAIGVNGKDSSWSPLKKKHKKSGSKSPTKPITKLKNYRNQKIKLLTSSIMESDLESSFRLVASNIKSAKPIKVTEFHRRARHLNTSTVLNDSRFKSRSDNIADDVRRRGDMQFRGTVSSEHSKHTPTVFTEISGKLKNLFPSSEPTSAIMRDKVPKVRRTDSGTFSSLVTPMPKIANVCVLSDNKQPSPDKKKRTIREKSFEGVFFNQISPCL